MMPVTKDMFWDEATRRGINVSRQGCDAFYDYILDWGQNAKSGISLLDYALEELTEAKKDYDDFMLIEIVGETLNELPREQVWPMIKARYDVIEYEIDGVKKFIFVDMMTEEEAIDGSV